ncbi:MAG: hypothetical protein A2Z46_00030 [Nitrospirae bacterium RBG_19FT_COMBO_55_12]|nr:MAG: hypothetical protein A2Z46_00030 [Nitrospirae bacterium RBG_19FT_COMBO_55_12]
MTFDSVKSWREQIKNILRESAKIVDILFIYTAFRSEDERYALELFWVNTPSPASRNIAETVIHEGFLGKPAFDAMQESAISHAALLPSPLREMSRELVELETKTFGLAIPVTSGIVGIGLRLDREKDATDALIVESILTAIVNIVSSVMAVTTYTREIERFATRDPLTNLYNQVAFWDLLEYETERSKRQKYSFSLLVMDIDNFKAINDTCGHEVGDTFLKQFASLVKTAVRKGDVPARYGGDNFTAILPVCDEEQAYIVAKRIIESLRALSLPSPEGVRAKGTVSIGLAVYPGHAAEAKDLFLLADSMMVQAKTLGKDRVCVPSEHDTVGALRSLGGKNILIMEALGQKTVVPYFQPIINMKTRRVEAYEVLTRIVTPDGVIAAAEFIETAETMGAIGRLDYQLIERTFEKVKKERYDGALFLNLSPKALILSEFIPTVRSLLREYGINPAKMVFEITERDTVKNLGLVEKFIHDLRSEGFRFAIDDFGSGYSSFQYIRKFSIDFLKIDGEFVKNMTEKGTIEKAIVTSIAALAKSLGIKTIAEYVETEQIMSDVESVGIDFAQGYYIRRPSPELL